MVFPVAKKVMAFPVQARGGACDSWTRSPATAARLNPSGKNDSGVACVLLGCDGALHAMCRATVTVDTGARRQGCQGVPLRYWSCGHSKKAARSFGVRCFRTERRMRVRSCPIYVFREPSPLDASRMNARAGTRGSMEMSKGRCRRVSWRHREEKVDVARAAVEASRVRSLTRVGRVLTRHRGFRDRQTAG